eukprot:TRINITY_DN17151_c0_g1_i1.p1 TRINITY_DN17151_c0_g1~~TRINITY_DN17151_c0_g1_i1.p1  ORF type:complete len:332 (-),score=9.21 TRINITY_DN17151_c0_g1_i1:156-1100(-)
MDAIFANLFPNGPAGPNPGRTPDGGPEKRGPRSAKPSFDGVLRAGALAGCSFAAGSGLLLAAHRKTSPVAIADDSVDRPMPSTMLPLGSLSVAAADAAAAASAAPTVTVTEPATGIEFPETLEGGPAAADRQLAGLGVRAKNLLGLAKVKVYAYGVYVDEPSLKRSLRSKYGPMTADALRGSRWLINDTICSDVGLTVRLVIHYKSLKMSQVRNAFTESLGGRMKELSGGVPQTELLQSFTKWFTDEVKLHKGTVIDISRKPGHVLETKIDGNYMGSTKSALVSRALFELYVGDKPFDQKAREGLVEKIIKVVH